MRYQNAPPEERSDIERRVQYYNRLTHPFALDGSAMSVATYQRGKSWAYHLDFKPLIHCFPPGNRFDYLPGDITHVPLRPTFVKSRPISDTEENANSVLLKLNQIRHYYMPRDPYAFQQKYPLAVWRGSAHRDKRRTFVETCYEKAGCNIADVSRKSQGLPWHGKFLSIQEQMKYRFILSVEGNDVATNVKWIMASNSLCMMARPEFETWYMEGALVAGKHYVQLRDDYTDLEEKIEYYNTHPREAQEIVKNANAYAAQFLQEEREFLIALLVMDKYFHLAGYSSVFGAWEGGE